MRYMVMALIALTWAGVAQSSPREGLSPEGQATFKAFYSKKVVNGGIPDGAYGRARDLNRKIRALVNAGDPDLKLIHALRYEEHRASMDAKEEAFRETSDLLSLLAPADQLVFLRERFPSSVPPILTPTAPPKAPKPSR